MEPYVDERLGWRSLGSEDRAAVEALRTQINQVDDPLLTEVDLLVADSDQVGSVSIGGWDAYGSLVAYGQNVADTAAPMLSVHLVGGVHPAHRYKGIGRGLLTWQTEAAREWRDVHHPGQDLWIGCYVDHSSPNLARILERLGFSPERFFYDLHRDLEAIPPVKQVPGIRIVSFREELSEDVRQLHNRCFTTREDVLPVEPDQWHEQLANSRFRPGWSFVALSSSGPVGYAISRLDETPTAAGEPCGWTEKFGVAPEFRGRGIAVALLSATLESMAADGCGGAGVGVDTIDPATPQILTEQLGYEARDGLVLYSRIDPARVG